MTAINSKTNKTEDKKPKIAAIYARVSSGKQIQGFSLDQQIQLCRQRCEQNGWKVRFLFREDGISGATTDRPKFNAMMQVAKQQKIDIVVTWKLDRLFRSLIDAANIEKKLGEWNVSICSITEALDTTTSNGRFVFRTLASASEWERDMIAERARMGMQALALKHQWPSRIIPFGYDIKNDGHLKVNNVEAEIVKKMYKRYIQVKSMNQLAFELNMKGIKPRRADQWSATVVKYILDNRLYTGQYQVAGISEYIPELRIISDKLYSKVHDTRYRHKRKAIPKDRKEYLIDKLIQGYKQFLDDMENMDEEYHAAIYGE